MSIPIIVSIPEAAGHMARRLAQALHADAVYLFGSYARGEAGVDSDLDLLVVVPDSPLPRYARAIHAREVVNDMPQPKDIVVLTRKEWETDQRVVCSLASTVLREGIRLHG